MAISGTAHQNAGTGTSNFGGQTAEQHAAGLNGSAPAPEEQDDDIDRILNEIVPEEGATSASPESEPAEEGTQDAREGDGDEAPSPASEDEDGDGTATPDADKSLSPPEHWSADDKALFDKQPDEVKQNWLDRDKAMTAAHTKRSQELASERETLKPLQEAVAEHDDYLRQRGTTPGEAFKRLIGVERILFSGTPQQKAAAFTQLAHDYGIDLNGQTQQASEDPHVLALQQQVAQLNARLQGGEQMRTQTEEARANRSIEDFVNAKDDSGNPAHPHFEQVRGEMSRMARDLEQQGIQPDLGQLYAEAVWRDPELRKSMLAAERQAALDEKKQKDAEHLKKAKKASTSVSGAGSAVREQPEDDIDKILDDIVPHNF